TVVRRIARSHREDRNPLVDEGYRPMLHLTGRVALRVDVRELLQLERTLQGDRVAETATEIEKVLVTGEYASQIGDVRVQRYRAADESRDIPEVLDTLPAVVCGQVLPLAAEDQGQQVADGDRSGKRLRRRDTDFGAGVSIDGGARLSRESRAHDVGD